MQSSQTPAFAEHADQDDLTPLITRTITAAALVWTDFRSLTFRCLLLLPFVLCLFVTALILNKVVV